MNELTISSARTFTKTSKAGKVTEYGLGKAVRSGTKEQRAFISKAIDAALIRNNDYTKLFLDISASFPLKGKLAKDNCIEVDGAYHFVHREGGAITLTAWEPSRVTMSVAKLYADAIVKANEMKVLKGDKLYYFELCKDIVDHIDAHVAARELARAEREAA